HRNSKRPERNIELRRKANIRKKGKLNKEGVSKYLHERCKEEGAYETLGSTKKTLKIFSNGKASESRRRRSDWDAAPGKPREETRVWANERAAPRRSARFAQSAPF
ncbi:unnamed protein product, partial [Ixodes persulcatus]